MTTFVKQIEQVLRTSLKQEDIYLLTKQAFTRIEEDDLFKTEYYYFLTLNEKPIFHLINQFWRRVFTGYKYPPVKTTHFTNSPVNYDCQEKWRLLFNRVIDENFSGLVAEIAKMRLGANIRYFINAVHACSEKKGFKVLC